MTDKDSAPTDRNDAVSPNTVTVGLWGETAKWSEVARHRGAGTVTFDLPGGQHVQVSVHADGTFGLRAWPSTAIVTANCEALSLSARVPTLDEMADGTLAEARCETFQHAAKYVIKPEDNEWGYADKRARAIATEFHARRSTKMAADQDSAPAEDEDRCDLLRELAQAVHADEASELVWQALICAYLDHDCWRTVAEALFVKHGYTLEEIRSENGG